MDWINSIQRALNYIEDHLFDKTLSNDIIAKEAYSSNSNFQRIFSLITGGTIADYIRCRKLTLAGEELANTDAKIIDIALKYGYDTPESFTKAFVRFHGITPAKIRNGFGSLRHFDPIVFRLTIEGGFTTNTKIISHITTIVNTDMGENYHFNGIARYIMQCLGETVLSDYSLFAGITGDNMVQFYPLTDWKADSASDYYLGLRGFVSVFHTVGYEAEAISETEFSTNYGQKISQIKFSIDRGIPVIWYHNGQKNVIVGYEQEGETLLYMTFGIDEPKRITLNQSFFENKQANQNGFIIVGSKQKTVSLRQIYRKAILQLPKLLTLQTGAFVFGPSAFRAWADDVENGHYLHMSPEEYHRNYLAYEVYVVNAATNSGGCQSFLAKAQELNPDFTFLEDVRRQYRIMNYLWNGGYWLQDVLFPNERKELIKKYGTETLETLGGSLGCKLETLQNPEKCQAIANQIRRFADCADEIVRIFSENLIS